MTSEDKKGLRSIYADLNAVIRDMCDDTHRYEKFISFLRYYNTRLRGDIFFEYAKKSLLPEADLGMIF